jgi:membrane-bound ClpP family serine protease
MMFLAKGLEALGIACVMIGLVQGLMNPSMWAELYLSIIGIVVFFAGRLLEKHLLRARTPKDASRR